VFPPRTPFFSGTHARSALGLPAGKAGLRPRQRVHAPAKTHSQPPLPFALPAEVAELVDAADSKSVARKGVWVRAPPSAPQPCAPPRGRRPALPAGRPRSVDPCGRRRRGFVGETWFPHASTSSAIRLRNLMVEVSRCADPRGRRRLRRPEATTRTTGAQGRGGGSWGNQGFPHAEQIRIDGVCGSGSSPVAATVRASTR
jgi:hypothetical protein